MRKSNNIKLNIFSSKKGFTIVEVMVVLVIMGILAAIVGPNASAYIDRINVKTYISAAKLSEDTVMALAGMQYSEIGNPIIGNPNSIKSGGGSTYNARWGESYSLDEKELGKQYVYLDSYAYKFNLNGAQQNFVRMAPANLAAPTAKRLSAGISEFEKRTGEPIIPPAPWAINQTYAASEKQAAFSVILMHYPDYFTGMAGSHYAALNPDRYFYYSMFGSWYNRDFDGKYITVLHNFKLMQGGNDQEISTKTDPNAFENALVPAEGWFVYEYKGYDSSVNRLGGTYYFLDYQAPE